MSQTDTPFKGADWEIAQVPIAVGVLMGMWDIDGGLEAFGKLADWVNKQDTGLRSPISIALREYILKILPKKALEDMDNPLLSRSAKASTRRIQQDELIKEIESATSLRLSRKDIEEIIFLMADMGYDLKQQQGKMWFVKS
jgi:hypothetical protein